MPRRFGPFLLLIAAFGLIASVARALPVAPTWPHERSDLAPDPAVHWGRLANGLRYAIRPNAEPKGRISLRFLVQAGSMEERDDERGLAHFIEHMAFRSTGRYPGGSLLEELQRLGIGFGPDNTAFTTFDYTIYHLELPNDRPETLREGLKVFREYADDLTFSAAEIERERGVVLSELATRDTPEARMNQANLDFLVPLARQTVRAPIGLAPLIRHFTPDQFRAFYHAWYRPERMIVSVVGDVDPAAVDGLIREAFASLVARGPARPEPAATLPAPAGRPARRSACSPRPAIVGLNLTLEHAEPEPAGPENRAQRIRNLHAALAFNMLQQRLDQAGTAPRHQLHLAHCQPRYLPQRLADQLAHAAQQDPRLAPRRSRCGAGTAARTRLRLHHPGTGRSEADFRHLLRPGCALRGHRVIRKPRHPARGCHRLRPGVPSPAVVQREMAPVLAAATLAECQAAFRAAWGGRPPQLFVGANSAFRIPATAVAGALAYSRRVGVLPPVDALPWPSPTRISAPPVPGPPRTSGGPRRLAHAVRQRHALQLQAHRLRSRPVLICARVGHGRLSQPADKPGLDYLADYGLLSGGLGAPHQRRTERYPQRPRQST